jgi:hypothetical protein
MRDLPNAGIGQLVFRTDGDWKSREVSGFLDSVDDSYNVLLGTVAVSVLGRSAPTVREALIAPVHVTSTWFAARGAADSFIHAESATLRDALREDMSGVFERESLSVATMRIAPPGLVVFAGLGELFQQLSGLLRDLWCRSAERWRTGKVAMNGAIHDHERRVVELQAVESFLRTSRGAPANPPGSLPRDTLLLSSGLHQIAGLIAAQRLRAMGSDAAVEEFEHPSIAPELARRRKQKR